MYSFVTSKNVKWCHIIWARHPVVVPGRVLYTIVLDRIIVWWCDLRRQANEYHDAAIRLSRVSVHDTFKFVVASTSKQLLTVVHASDECS